MEITMLSSLPNAFLCIFELLHPIFSIFFFPFQFSCLSCFSAPFMLLRLWSLNLMDRDLPLFAHPFELTLRPRCVRRLIPSCLVSRTERRSFQDRDRLETSFLFLFLPFPSPKKEEEKTSHRFLSMFEKS
jgi:hypothetical protein